VRCGRCGNENGEGNRFCGMCGAPLMAKTQPVPPPGRQAPGTTAGNMTVQKPNAANTLAGQPAREQDDPAAGTQGTLARSAGPGPMTRLALSTSKPPLPARGAGLGSAPMEANPEAGFEDAAAEPTISGPSFLGLNQPGRRPTASRREGRGDTGHLQTSGNLDYLLEDDEEEPKRGWGKLVFVLLALVLAGGFGYLHWKQGGFDWLTAASSKPAAAIQPAADATQKPADNVGTAGTNTAAGAAPNPGVTAAVPSGTAAPNATGAGPAETPVASSGNTSAPAGTPAAEQALGATQSATVPAPAVPTGTASPSSSQSTSPLVGAPQNAAQDKIAPTSATSGQADSSQTDSGEAITPAGTASPGAGAATQSSEGEQQPQAATAPHKAVLKPPVPKPSPAKPVDSVTEAQRYIYGRDVRQDCDRGLRMLKAAADRSDAKAMISLGALYSTGATCTPRDLPTAYRYFAMGLHKEPDNQALQDDLQKLWSQMTQPERQLAIKLSQ
jgi:hypothetical protein